MVRLEVIRNNQTASTTVMEIDSFDVDTITQELHKLPNFKPKLTGMFTEEPSQPGSHSVLNLRYSNSKKVKDDVVVRIIPLFFIMEAISSRI